MASCSVVQAATYLCLRYDVTHLADDVLLVVQLLVQRLGGGSRSVPPRGLLLRPPLGLRVSSPAGGIPVRLQSPESGHRPAGDEQRQPAPHVCASRKTHDQTVQVQSDRTLQVYPEVLKRVLTCRSVS
ncbi:hypothetical protein EYF80_047192 [Liparis tanakae]|uniref:Uncharacterized protein n=1 Tax=Liparis tanakae TaxID=230148 RepID=A0A4Z2FN17_9TELE|nr:hypothetical protein EYF80_047192 [Liparis tanakae]